MNLRQQIFTGILILIFCATAISQSEYVKFTPGARSVGLGNSLVGGAFSPTATFWNPATLAFVTSQQMAISFNAPFVVDYFAYSRFFPKLGAFGAAFSYPHHLNSQLSSTALAWSYRLQPDFSLGTSLNFQALNHIYYTTFNFGTCYQIAATPPVFQTVPAVKSILDDGVLSFGLNLANLPISNRHIKHSIRLGMYYENLTSGIILHSAVHLQQPQASFHLGIGARISPEWSLVAGIQDFNQNYLGGGLRYGGQNYAFDCIYANQMRSLQVSLVFILGKNSQQLARECTLKGRESVKQKNLRQALAEYQTAALYDSRNDTISNIIAYLERRIWLEDRKIDSLFLQASQQLRQNKIIAAAYLFLKVLEVDPYNKRAEESLKLIKPQVDQFIERLYQQALDAYRQGDLRQAEKIFKAILVIRKEHNSATHYLAQISDSLKVWGRQHFYRAWGFDRQNDFERAQKEYELALEYDPESEDIQERYDEFLDRLKKNREQKEKQLDTYLGRARQNLANKHFITAFRNFKNALSIDPDNTEAQAGIQQTQNDVIRYARQRFRRAKNAYNRHQYVNAENQFRDLVKLAELLPELQSIYHQSSTYLNRIGSLQTKECDELYQEGLNYLNEQNWHAALESFDKMIKQKCREKEAQEKYRETLSLISADSLVEMGNRYYENQNYSEAMKCFQKVVETRPDDADALRRIEECQARITQIVDEYFNRGMNYYAEENYQLAINQWQKLLEYNSSHQDALDYINRARERLNALEKLR